MLDQPAKLIEPGGNIRGVARKAAVTGSEIGDRYDEVSFPSLLHRQVQSPRPDREYYR